MVGCFSLFFHEETAGKIGPCRRNPRVAPVQLRKITARNSGDNSEKQRTVVEYRQ
jgi:hypothetical protein